MASKTSKGIRPLRLGIDVPFMLAVITLLAFGLIMVYSASWGPSMQLSETNSTDLIFLNQLRWALIGSVVAAVASFVDYRILRRFVVPLMLLALGLLVAVLLFGDDRFNSRRSFAGGSIQPSEFAKLIVIIYLSYWLFSKQENLNTLSIGLLPMMVIIALASGLILLQPDLSAALTIAMIGGILFFLAGVEFKQIVLIMVVIVALGALVVTIFPTGNQRFTEYITGLENPVEASFHIRRSLEAIVNGGVFGVGIGQGSTKFTGLPVSHTDSIFAVIAEETGLIGAAGVVALYGVFLWRGLVISYRAPDLFGKLLAAGLTIWIALEAMINMGVMVNVFPFAGNALPLMSAGGSSLTNTLLGIGLIMSISRVGNLGGKERDGRGHSAVVDLRGRNGRRSVSSPHRVANTRR